MDVVQVAAINPSRIAPGGIRSHVLGLSEALTKMGVEVTIVGAGPKPDGEGPRWRFITVTERFPLGSTAFLIRLARSARRLPLARAILHAHRPDDLAALVLRKDVAARVLTVHGMSAEGIRNRHGQLVAWGYGQLERIGFGGANKIVALDRTTEASLRESKAVVPSKVVLGCAGVDMDAFAPVPRDRARRDLGVPDRPTIAFVGRLAPEKNLSLLVEACRRIPGVQLLIAGDGPERLRLQKKSAGVPWIRLFDTLDRVQVVKLLNAADALALPSHREAMPAAAIESLACGTPVVASSVGGLRDLIRDGNGFLSEPTPEAFAGALSLAIRESEAIRSRCRASVAEFGWDRVARKMLALYEEVIP